MTTLFDYEPPVPVETAHARATDPDTSREAAEAITPRMRELQARVLTYAATEGVAGFTDRDLEAAMGDSGSTWRTRRAELTAKGFIMDSGCRQTYPPKGRRHIVWQVTAEGIKAAREQAS